MQGYRVSVGICYREKTILIASPTLSSTDHVLNNVGTQRSAHLQRHQCFGLYAYSEEKGGPLLIGKRVSEKKKSREKNYNFPPLLPTTLPILLCLECSRISSVHSTKGKIVLSRNHMLDSMSNVYTYVCKNTKATLLPTQCFLIS